MCLRVKPTEQLHLLISIFGMPGTGALGRGCFSGTPVQAEQTYPLNTRGPPPQCTTSREQEGSQGPPTPWPLQGICCQSYQHYHMQHLALPLGLPSTQSQPHLALSPGPAPLSGVTARKEMKAGALPPNLSYASMQTDGAIKVHTLL